MHTHKERDSIVDQAIRDPKKMYGVPDNVLRDDRLKPAEKKIILDSWALDQQRLMESEEENMTPSPKTKVSAGELLRDIQAASRNLN